METQKDLETPAFPEYPAHAVAVLPAAWFKDKIVLVGAKLSLEDRHRTPMAIIDDEWEGRCLESPLWLMQCPN